MTHNNRTTSDLLISQNEINDLYSRELTIEDIQRLEILHNRRANEREGPLSDDQIEQLPSYKIKKTDLPSHNSSKVKKRERKLSDKKEKRNAKCEEILSS
jgi:hypothetical protein